MKLIYQGLGVVALLSTAGVLPAQQGTTAFLKTNINPGRAGVFVDGKYVGPAGNFRIGRKYALPAGQHQVKLVDPRFEEFNTTVDLKAGKTTKLAEALKPLPPPKGPFGGLRTPVPDKYAAVYINEKFLRPRGRVQQFVTKADAPGGRVFGPCGARRRDANQSKGQNRGRKDSPRPLDSQRKGAAMPLSKRAAAEFLGTFWLVFGGCGSAVLAAAFPNVGIGLLGVSLAFGLTVLTMAYAIGHISGCHLNPAVSRRAVGRQALPGEDCCRTSWPRCSAAIVGAGGALRDRQRQAGLRPGRRLRLQRLRRALARRLLAGGRPGGRGRADLHVPDDHPGRPPTAARPQGFAPIAIGLGLTLIHLIGIPVTNLSVNPARSTGPAVFVGGWALAAALAVLAGADRRRGHRGLCLSHNCRQRRTAAQARASRAWRTQRRKSAYSKLRRKSSKARLRFRDFLLQDGDPLAIRRTAPRRRRFRRIVLFHRLDIAGQQLRPARFLVAGLAGKLLDKSDIRQPL